MKKDKPFEARLAKALRDYGHDFPLTEEELISSKEALKGFQYPEIPADLDNPTKILEKGTVDRLPKRSFEEEQEVLRNLAMAAREGGKIPDDVRKRMDEDRKNNEK